MSHLLTGKTIVRHLLIAALALHIFSVPGRAVADCREIWPSEDFFKTATAADVERCLAAGAKANGYGHGRVTPLHHAAKHGTAEMVAALLAAGANPDAYANSTTPLHVAVEHGTAEMVDALVAAGADSSKRDRSNRTPFDLAKLRGDQGVLAVLLDADVDCFEVWPSEDFFKTATAADVERCLAAGAKANGYGHGRGIPLHHAAKHGTAEMVDALLAAGANPDARANTGPPLHVAVEHGTAEMVAALVAAGADSSKRDRSNRTPFDLAKLRGDQGVLAVLLDADVDCFEVWPSEDFFKTATAADVERCLAAGAKANGYGHGRGIPLHHAAKHGTAEMVDALLAAGANPDARANTGPPLHVAVEHGTAEMVAALVAAGADSSKRDRSNRTPFDLAKLRGDQGVLAVLLDADIDCFEVWPSEDFFKTATAADVERCLAAGAKANGYGHGRVTPLHHAAKHGTAETVRMILAAGGDPNARSNYSATPLHTAAEHGTAEIIDVLLAAGADPSGRARTGDDTPLHVAAKHGTDEMVDALLAAGANPDAYANSTTPLHVAAEHGTAETVAALVAAGADSSKRGLNDRTPFDLAKLRGDQGVLSVLLDAGIDCFHFGNREDFFKTATVLDVERCLALGADPSARSHYSAPFVLEDTNSSAPLEGAPLHSAVRLGTAEVVATLLAAGADPSILDGSQRTPFRVAKSRGDEGILAVLRDVGAHCFETWNFHFADDFFKTATAADVERCLASGLDPNIRDSSYDTTPLHHAAKYGNAEVVSILVAGGADPSARDTNDETPLHYAAQYDGNAETVRILVAAGADPNARGPYSDPLIHTAVERGTAEVVAALLSAGADPRVRNSGRTLLSVARSGGDEEVLAVLRDAGIDCIETWNTGRFFKVATAAEVERCLNFGTDPNARGTYRETPLHLAAEQGTAETVQVLLAASADPNARADSGVTPLHMAAGVRTAEKANLLLDAGANLDARANGGETPLHYAAYYRPLVGHTRHERLTLVEILLAAGADPNARTISDDHTPLHFAAQHGTAEIVAALLAAGADPNARRKSGWTPLHIAAEFGTATSVTALLEAGADASAAGRNGMTPFDLAERNLNLAGTDVIRRLENLNCKNWYSAKFFEVAAATDIERCMALGSDPNVRNAFGESPLHMAAYVGNAEALVALLAGGADIEQRSNRDGRTPLHAAAFSSAAAANALLAGGADTEALSNSGNTPLHDALVSKAETVRALLDGGANPNARADNGDGASPLENAAVFALEGGADLEMLTALLEAGADPNDRSGKQVITALHRAAMTLSDKKVEKIAALLEAGADPKVRDSLGKIPFAYVRGSLDLVGTDVYRRLAVPGHEQPNCWEWNSGTFFPSAKAALIVRCLAGGADIAARDEFVGWTPLHRAALSGSPEAVMALLEAGADPKARDEFDKTPFDLAKENAKLAGTDAFRRLNDARFQ